MLGWFYALLAGCLGSAASLSAKLTLGADYVVDLCQFTLGTFDAHAGPALCQWLHVPLRLLCVGLMLSCNAAMWAFFSKALRHCSSTASASVTTTAGNFISSAALGKAIFGESQAVLWWAGISLTLCGLLLLHGSMPQRDGKKD